MGLLLLGATCRTNPSSLLLEEYVVPIPPIIKWNVEGDVVWITTKDFQSLVVYVTQLNTVIEKANGQVREFKQSSK